MKYIVYILTLYCLIQSPFISGQTLNTKVAPEKEKELETLDNALTQGDEKTQAEAYYNLGNIYLQEQDYVKAESYFNKSLKLYNKLGIKSKVAKVSRKLAQVQEKLNKKQEALYNYKQSYDNFPAGSERGLNANDISRLNTPNLEEQRKSINRNLELNSLRSDPEDAIQQYTQLAEIDSRENKNSEAVIHLENAYNIARENSPKLAVKLKNEQTELLKKNNQLKAAIATKEKLLKEDFVEKDSKLESQQLQELASLYEENKDHETAMQTLRKSYDLAISKGHTLEAQRAVEKMDSLYALKNETGERLNLYKNFIYQLPQVIDKDSALVNEKVLRESEEKIRLLENEQLLSSALVTQKNYLNYGLLALLVLLGGFLIYAVLTLKKLRTQNKKIALQSLSKDMNPHFIFNSLNSINQFISQSDEREANKYLSRFSKLMRGVLENSNQDFLNLEDEISQLNNYLELEQQRFSEQFSFSLEVDSELEAYKIQVPVMIIQPFIENAIWHGLRYKEEKGHLKLSFQKENEELWVRVTDNGIGREASKKQKTEYQKQHNGIGIPTTLKRIEYINDLYKKGISTEIKDLSPGTQVSIRIKI